jgi:hypothetical protein
VRRTNILSLRTGEKGNPCVPFLQNPQAEYPVLLLRQAATFRTAMVDFSTEEIANLAFLPRAFHGMAFDTDAGQTLSPSRGNLRDSFESVKFIADATVALPGHREFIVANSARTCGQTCPQTRVVYPLPWVRTAPGFGSFGTPHGDKYCNLGTLCGVAASGRRGIRSLASRVCCNMSFFMAVPLTGSTNTSYEAIVRT